MPNAAMSQASRPRCRGGAASRGGKGRREPPPVGHDHTEEARQSPPRCTDNLRCGVAATVMAAGRRILDGGGYEARQSRHERERLPSSPRTDRKGRRAPAAAPARPAGGAPTARIVNTQRIRRMPFGARERDHSRIGFRGVSPVFFLLPDTFAGPGGSYSTVTPTMFTPFADGPWTSTADRATPVADCSPVPAHRVAPGPVPCQVHGLHRPGRPRRHRVVAPPSPASDITIFQRTKNCNLHPQVFRMDASPRSLLIQIVETYSPGVIDDRTRLRNLLDDYFQGNYRRERNTLIASLEEGIPHDLIQSRASVLCRVSSGKWSED